MSMAGSPSISDNKQQILRALAKAMPTMSDYRKGYFLGYAEAMSDKKENGGPADGPSEPAFAESEQ